MKTLVVLLWIQVIAVTLEYEFRCPVAGEWRLRPRKLLCGATQYVCLLYLPDKTYHETCDGLDYSRKGSKLVFEPNFNKARCNYNRFQPFPFSTDGSSACVYKKSFCNAEGQFLFNKGSLENDTRCGCDVSKGYTFTTNPRNKCYCRPLEEDCSCYKPTCNSKGTDCIPTEAVIMNASCSVLSEGNKPPSSIDKIINKRNHFVDYNDDGRGTNYKLPCVYFTVAVLIMIIVTGLFADQLTTTVTMNNEKMATEYGKSVTLTCDVGVICTCFVKSFEWYQNRKIIACCRNNTTKYELDRTRSMLTIKDVDKNDLGEYACVLRTIFFTYTSEKLQLVYALPEITVKSEPVEILDNGKSIELSCEVLSETELTSIKWYKGSDLLSKNITKYEAIGNIPKILTIHNVDVNDKGTYTCRVENEKGFNESKAISVVYALPVITVISKSVEILEKGNSIELSCEVLSETELTSIKWYKGYDLLSENITKYEVIGNVPTILTIHKVDVTDKGIYTCRVENEKGFNESEAITVEYNVQNITTSDFMEKIKSGIEARQYIRIQVIGKEGVGKSSLVRRLLGKRIDGIKSTDGIDICKNIQISKVDGTWKVDDVETERKKRIRRILQITDIKEKSKELHYDKQELVTKPSVTKGNLCETKPTEVDKIHTSQKQEIRTDTPGSNEVSIIHDDTKKTIDNFSTISNSDPLAERLESVKPSGDEHSNEDDSQVINVKNPEQTPETGVLQNPTSLIITPEMMAKMYENMDKILLEVKKGKEVLKSDGVVECGIWDFAGQKDYYVTHQTFLTSDAIYLLVANVAEDIKAITDDENVDSVGEYIDFWFDSIHSCCENPEARILNPPIIVVCTHTDKYPELDKRIREYDDNFNQIIGVDKKANHKRRIHYITNTKVTDEIDNLKKTINEIAKEMNYFEKKLPTQWIQLENALDFLTNDLKRNIISFKEIKEIARTAIIDKHADLLEFLNYQHKIGNIIFFEDIPEYIILQSNWLVKCFRCLVFDDDPAKRCIKVSTLEWKTLTETGKLSDTIIDNLFEKEDELKVEHKPYLLDVMAKFDIIVKPQCVDTKGDDPSNSYYIPCMIRNLPTSLTDIKKLFGANDEGVTRSPWFILEFTFLPFAYFNHILVSYIREYIICGRDDQKSIYGGKAVFFLDESQSQKFIICYSKNAISLQIWDWDECSDDQYIQVLGQIRDKIKELETKIRHTTTYVITAKCSDGDYFKRSGRISFKEREKRFLPNGKYFCKDHGQMHNKEEIVNAWFKHVDTVFQKHEEKIHKNIQFPWLVDGDGFQRMLSKGEYLSYENRLSLGGPCRAGKSTLASVLIGEQIPLRWNSTDGLVIFFGRNGIDIENKKMIPLKDGKRGHEVLAKILRGKPTVGKESDQITRQEIQTSVRRVRTNVYTVLTSESTTNFSQDDNETTKYTTDQFPIKTYASTTQYDMEHHSTQMSGKSMPSTTTNIQTFDIRKMQLQSDILEEVRNGQYRINIAPSDIIDFGGQKSYDMTHQLFIQNRGSFLLMFDGRLGLHTQLCEYPDGITAASILKHWVDSILTYTEDTVDIMPMIMFAATHRDLCKGDIEETRLCFIRDIKNMFSHHEKRHHIHLDTVYFINGIDENDPEIQHMTDQVVLFAMQQSSWGQRRPMQWVPLELQISNMRMKNVNIITMEDLRNINKLNDDLALRKDQLNDFLSVQHSHGKLIYYNRHGLDKFIIIHPPGLVNILKSFVTDEKFFPVDKNLKSILQTLMQTGKISRTDLFQLWQQDNFRGYMRNDSIKEFVIQLLVHLDILIVPKVLEQFSTNVFLVPCMIKTLPPADFKNLQHHKEKTICLKYSLTQNSIPTALAYKIIGAAISIWPLKEEGNKPTKPCLYHKAAVLNVSEDDELRIWLEDNRVMVNLTNKNSLLSITQDVAASIQECLTKTIESSLLFYFNNFGNKITPIKVLNLFTLELGVPCGNGVCFKSAKEVSETYNWTCDRDKKHETKYLLCWIFDKYQTMCGLGCKGLSNDELKTKPSDKHLVRLGNQIGIHSFLEFYFHLGMTTRQWENTLDMYGGHSCEEIMSMALVKWKYSKLSNREDPSLKDLSDALGKINLNNHLICQVFREETQFRGVEDFNLQKIPSGEVLKELSYQVGNRAIQLGIELGLSFNEVENSVYKFPKDLPGLIEDILKKWKAKSKIKTFQSLILALTRVNGGGVKYLLNVSVTET